MPLFCFGCFVLDFLFYENTSDAIHSKVTSIMPPDPSHKVHRALGIHRSLKSVAYSSLLGHVFSYKQDLNCACLELSYISWCFLLKTDCFPSEQVIFQNFRYSNFLITCSGMILLSFSVSLSSLGKFMLVSDTCVCHHYLLFRPQEQEVHWIF